MFKTKKQLKYRIAELEDQIKTERDSFETQIAQLKDKLKREEHHNRRSALVEKADLPKCKSPACYSCKHIAYILHPGNGALYLIGCGKDLNCPDFQEREESAESVETLRETLYSMVKYYFPDLKFSPAYDCVHIPPPPCHSAQCDIHIFGSLPAPPKRRGHFCAIR